MNKLIVLFFAAVLTGCALMEGSAGKAHYTMEPVVKDGVVVCCKVDILNAKDIGKVTASATKLDDGTYEILLSEEGVNSSAPMEVMVKQNALMMEMLMKALSPVPGT